MTTPVQKSADDTKPTPRLVAEVAATPAETPPPARARPAQAPDRRRCRSPSRSAAATCGRPAGATSRPRTPMSSRTASRSCPRSAARSPGSTSPRTSRSRPARPSSPSTTRPTATPSSRPRRASPPPGSTSSASRPPTQQAVAEAANARDTLATAETQDDRQQSLRKSGVISQSAADDSALQLQIAKGDATKAESAVLSAKAALAGNPDIATDQHPEVLQAFAKLHAAEIDLQRTVVVAPADGVISQTDRLQQGQYVTPATAVAQPRRHGQELDRGELQGDRAHPHDAGPARRGHHRHLRRPRPEGRARLDRRRHRRGVRAASRRRTPPATGSRSSSASPSASPSTTARTCRRCAPA